MFRSVSCGRRDNCISLVVLVFVFSRSSTLQSGRCWADSLRWDKEHQDYWDHWWNIYSQLEKSKKDCSVKCCFYFQKSLLLSGFLPGGCGCMLFGWCSQERERRRRQKSKRSALSLPEGVGHCRHALRGTSAEAKLISHSREPWSSIKLWHTFKVNDGWTIQIKGKHANST